MRKTIILACFLIFHSALFAQNKSTDEEAKAKIQVLGRAQKDKIMIRWAPDSPVAWEYANKYGYIIEKYTILRNGKMLQPVEKEVLTDSVLKPWPIEKWEALADKDDYAAVAAEALYAETFEVTESFSSDIVSVINKARELEYRFSFALFAADQSFPAAEASALAYIDHNVKPEEKYLYKIYSPVPAGTMELDTGFVYVGLSDYAVLPKPEGLQAEFRDKLVILKWEGLRFQDFYNSFVLERSDDGGKSYKPVSDKPIINTHNENGEYPEFIVKIDSIPEYDKEYFYRVRGVSIFGELSPASDSVSVKTNPILSFYPEITGSKVLSTGQVQINWKFPEDGQELIEGFEIRRSGKLRGESIILSSRLNPSDRMYIDIEPLNSNYYTIIAFDKYGNSTSSLPSLAMLEDSIPPVPPVNLAGKIDTSGIVALGWTPNKENDLLGYRVYRSNFLNKEFIQLTVSPVKEAVFIDTVEIKTLTDKVYYKIVAVDKHFNPSGFSATLELERPDVIPPAPPVFQTVKGDETGIFLTWAKSSSRDVQKHVLYRKTASEQGWAPIEVFEKGDLPGEFHDKKTVEDLLYAYTIIAVDKHGLESAPAKPVTLKRTPGQKPEIKHLIAEPDRQNNLIRIQWKYSESQVSKYLIYRARENDSMQLYKVLSSTDTEFTDDNLKSNSLYKYRLQAEFENGLLSPFSKEVVVIY